MIEKDIINLVKEVITEHGLFDYYIDKSSELIKDLDTTNMAELVFYLEHQFDITIENKLVKKWNNVEDIINTVKDKL